MTALSKSERVALVAELLANAGGNLTIGGAFDLIAKVEAEELRRFPPPATRELPPCTCGKSGDAVAFHPAQPCARHPAEEDGA